jgi:hypothetical protein
MTYLTSESHSQPYLNQAKMTKTIPIVAAAIIVTVVLVFWKMNAATTPYAIKPTAVLEASKDATVGHTVDIAKRALLVISQSDVVVVADPGASFQHEVLWLVPVPRTDGSSDKRLYRFETPQFAAAEHIHPIGTPLAPDIAKFASDGHWK